MSYRSIKLGILSTFILLNFQNVVAQSNSKTTSEIYHDLCKLAELKKVLYIAAHPDDENTRLIAYLSKELNAETAYLSLTRGSGGQNLIGNEKGALMGALRTQELLEARKIDGGKQFFTRAVDFGYSKNSNETLSKWNKQEILSDVVWVIRKFKPDVIITRFPTSSYAGHGHHSTSAILAEEAFDLAASKKAFPEQLEYVDTWKPKRLYFNASSWWDKEIEQKAQSHPEDYITIDVGEYNPMLGKSYAEIAAESRTMHKSQGFGSEKSKGSRIEYLKYVKGDKAKNNDIFYDVPLDWNQVKGGKFIHDDINRIVRNFDFTAPSKTVQSLLDVRKKIENTNNDYWRIKKLKELDNLILSCIGLHMELKSDDFEYSEEDVLRANLRLINRSKIPITIASFNFQNKQYDIGDSLLYNISYDSVFATAISDFENPQPYWLRNAYQNMYDINDFGLLGQPANEPCLSGRVTINLLGEKLIYTLPLLHKKIDPVNGEVFRPVVIVPKITANLSKEIYMTKPDESIKVNILIQGYQDSIQGKVRFRLPTGWSANKIMENYKFDEKNEVKSIPVEIVPGQNAQNGEIEILDENNNILSSVQYIDYDHINAQTIFNDCRSKILILNIETKRKKIGYIPGAGDDIPVALNNLGYEVIILDKEYIEQNALDEFDAIITGIRAYNTQKYLQQLHPNLMQYVKNGGNLVVQYCTSHRLVLDQFGPYPMKLGRGRVTVEEAEPTLLEPGHKIFNTPNKITSSDFEHWIQERGLYFASEWNSEYTPLISWSDPGEKTEKGAIIVTNYGKGTFVYTGISFFRELPAGVIGAYKLFTNIIEYKQ